jgi:hypothetical protein
VSMALERAELLVADVAQLEARDDRAGVEVA